MSQNSPTGSLQLADQPDPLDVAQQFTATATATSYAVRDELEELIRADLLDLRAGEHEEFAPQAMGPT